jgi:NAD(P)-dependent dehydrogenase (short-subunit alcohol dehydrogenase family)
MGSLSRVVKIDSSPPGDGPRRSRSTRHTAWAPSTRLWRFKRRNSERIAQLAATALKRYGHAEDIAPMVAFIAGPDSGYITGASLTIDGGTNA